MCTYTTTNSHLFPYHPITPLDQKVVTLTMSEKVKEKLQQKISSSEVLATGCSFAQVHLCIPIEVGWNMMYGEHINSNRAFGLLFHPPQLREAR